MMFDYYKYPIIISIVLLVLGIIILTSPIFTQNIATFSTVSGSIGVFLFIVVPVILDIIPMTRGPRMIARKAKLDQQMMPMGAPQFY